MQARDISPGLTLLVAVLSFVSLPASAQLSISNETLRVDANVTAGQFNITALATRRTFVRGGQFTAAGGTGTIGFVTTPGFGRGQHLEIEYPNGNRDDVVLFPNLPFALFQTTISNRSSQTVISNSIQTLTLPEDLAEPVSVLAMRTTGGLFPAAANTNSYEWLAIADPTNGNGIVNGWITDNRATGMIASRN